VRAISGRRPDIILSSRWSCGTPRTTWTHT